MVEFFIVTLLIVIVLGAAATFAIFQYKNGVQEAKNYERGLKMVPLYIHIPPASDDLDKGGRDERDLTEEVLSQAQVMSVFPLQHYLHSTIMLLLLTSFLRKLI